MHVEYRWNDSDGGKRIAQRKTCFSATFSTVCVTWPTPMPARSKACLGPIAFSDFGFECCCEHGYWMSVCCECCVLSFRGVGLGLITLPEESYRLSVCVCVCMSLSVIRCDIDLLRLQWGGRRGQNKKERKKEMHKLWIWRQWAHPQRR
jgi:hypothetical protein